MSERQNIEIDYCPKCRGVWLDRGELDKIVERVETEGVPRGHLTQPQDPAYRETYRPQPREHREYDDDYKHGQHGGQSHHKKRKESWLGELFD